jgi:hypothetical protein
VAQRGRDDAPHVVERRREPAVGERADLRPQDDGLRAARRAAVAHELAHGGDARPLGVRGLDDAHGVVLDGAGHGHLAHEVTELEQARAAEDGAHHRIRRARRAVEDRVQLLVAGQRDAQLEEEAVELRLGQRVRPLHLDGVLRGQHEERRGQRVRLLADGDRALLHGLEQRRLRLGRRAVDLVGEHEVREDRPALELEAPGARRSGLDDHVRADDVGGHEVGRELDAREGEVERLGQRLHEQRLAEAGHALEQDVAAGQQRRHHALDDLRLAHEALAHLAREAPEVLAEAGHGLGGLGQVGRGRGRSHRRRRGDLRGRHGDLGAAAPPARGRMSWK